MNNPIQDKSSENFSEKAKLYFRLMLINGAAFVVCYVGPNYYASISDVHYRFYFSWESAIPFYPSWIYIYLTISLWFLLPLFVLDAEAIRKLSRAFLVTTLIGGVCFMLFPAQSPFDRSQHQVGSNAVYQLVYFLDKPHNLVPSLHIAYGILFLCVFQAKKVSGLLLWYVWAAAMMVSVLLTHQHSIMDIIGGMLLGGGVYWYCYESAVGSRA